MNKKLLAVAVAGALAAPVVAFAQSTVTLYGRANAGFDNWKATGSTTGATTDFRARNRIYDSGSRLGFRGTEDLGGGVSAYFVIEAGVNMDQGGGNGQSGAANASTGSLASRDSFVGMKNNSWGEVSFGRQSIYWSNGLNSQTGANYINAGADGLLNGSGLVAIPVSRQSNVVAYTSPRLMGMWDISVAYSPTRETATAGPAVSATTTQTNDNIFGLNVKFRTGPWYAQFDTARTKLEASALGRRNTGHKLGVSYGYATDSRVGLIWQRSTNKSVAAVGTVAIAGDNLRQSVWLLNVEHAMGPWRLYGQMANLGSVSGGTGTSSGSGTKSTGHTLGVKYMFSPRTGVYTSYNRVSNGANAFADQSGGGYSSAAATGLAVANSGADLRVWGIGMMHNF